MRHSHLSGLILPLAIAITGCGPDTSSDSAFNPATDVDLVFSTFDLEDQEGRPANLEHTRFWDFYRGMEPADGDDTAARDLANQLRDHIDVFIGAIRADNGVGYRLVRNPLDLMNQVIASGEVTNFNEGRNYISDRIDEGQAATYNTRSNGALIRFVDQAATVEERALADRTWIYQTLAWTYNPEGPEGQENFEKVYRTIQYIARQAPEGETAEPPQLVSFLAGTRFDATTFSVTGYNQPELATVDFVTHDYGSMELRQDYVGEKTDTVFLSNTDGIEINGSTPDCIRAELDYEQQRLLVFTSTGEPTTLENGDHNPRHCANQVAGDEETSYATQPIAERQ